MSVQVLIPIYQPRLASLEALAVRCSVQALASRRVHFIGPASLPLAWYRAQFPAVNYMAFDDHHFASVAGYSRLLLSTDFYRRFAEHEFILILQTDAVVLRDELDYWCAQPFDYIGAPWPGGHNLQVAVDRLASHNGVQVHARVGNGGFSLRRIQKCIRLLEEFPQAVQYFLHTGSSEDLFFGFMGPLSNDFVMPNEITASRFSMEMEPSKYFVLNGGHLPMGGHAWQKYEPEFWLPHLPGAQELLREKV